MSETSPVVDCCTPLAGSTLLPDEAVELERLFKAFGDRHRLRILNALLEADGEAVCVCEFQPMLGIRVLPAEAGGSGSGRPTPRRAAAEDSRLSPPRSTLARPLGAEVAGTFALVFFGAGAIMVDAESHPFGQLGIAAALGLVIMAMVYAVGHVSGAHLNPAVTLSFALTRHFPWAWVGAYWFAQVAGALLAAAALRFSLGDVADVRATVPSGSQVQSFSWEVVLTAVLLFVIMAVATDTRAVGEAAAIAIGGTVGLGALVGGPVSGGSMNPARSLGPALVSGDPDDLWIYLVAPLVGGALGAVAYQLLRGSPSVRGSAGEAEPASSQSHSALT